LDKALLHMISLYTNTCTPEVERERLEVDHAQETWCQKLMEIIWHQFGDTLMKEIETSES